MAVGVDLIINSVIGAIGGYIETKQKSRSARAQAAQLSRNVETIRDEIDQGRIDLNEGLKRIDTLISSTKGELRGVMEKQVNLATKQLKQQYGAALTQTMKGITSELGQRRLLGSEFGTAARRKTATQLSREAGEQTSALRERALGEITSQIAQLNLKGGLLKEGKREGFQQFRLGSIGEIMQLENMAQSLESQADISPFLGAFRGAVTGGLGKIAGELFEPGAGLKETPVEKGTITGLKVPGIEEKKIIQ